MDSLNGVNPCEPRVSNLPDRAAVVQRGTLAEVGLRYNMVILRVFRIAIDRIFWLGEVLNPIGERGLNCSLLLLCLLEHLLVLLHCFTPRVELCPAYLQLLGQHPVVY